MARRTLQTVAVVRNADFAERPYDPVARHILLTLLGQEVVERRVGLAAGIHLFIRKP